ncbi:MAG: AmmeMemoRadiSam system protein B [Deltaproteobacteria bacterium]|nr:AmmeMemoRadiSam system protein B [Deltaproteobacteria bacterium]
MSYLTFGVHYLKIAKRGGGKMNDLVPSIRKDLEFFPFQHQGKQLILIRDHLGLVPEGKAIEIGLYRLMSLLDGTTTILDIQTGLMRQHGGTLVASDEVKKLLSHLDDSFLLDSERFKKAKDRIVEEFTSNRFRPCSHSGQAYPENPVELSRKLDEIMGLSPSVPALEGKPVALVSPHIDISVGRRGYACAYGCLKNASPAKVIVLGVGHHGFEGLFALTGKEFLTPLGNTKTENVSLEKLKDAGEGIIAPNDFAHKAEHSIEFQVIFLQHVLKKKPFKIIPILCGSLLSALREYGRSAYLEKAGPFLAVLSEIARDPETLMVTGVDFSHVGPKFGHPVPARHLDSHSEAHDRSLLQHLVSLDAEAFWEESKRVNDQYNVCGFAALACLLEVLPPAGGRILHYETWHEEATGSAVSFAAVVFAEQKER